MSQTQYQRLIERGTREAGRLFSIEKDKPARLEWDRHSVPIISGESDSYEEEVDGGTVEVEAMVFMILRSELDKAGAKPPKQGKVVRFCGKKFTVKKSPFDPVDPTISLICVGEEQ